MKTIAVTGAGGILGREIIDQLQNNLYYRVIAINIISENEIRQENNIIYYKYNKMEDCVWKEIDILIHCAFSRSFNGFLLAESLKITQSIFEMAVKNGVKNIINISSRSVYGQNPDIPWSESSSVQPDTHYAIAKYATELLTQSVNTPDSLTTNLRLSGLVGIGTDSRVVNKLVCQCINEQKIKIIGGKQQFGFLDVRDAASAIITLLSIQDNNWRSIYNLGAPRVYTLEEIACLIIEIGGKHLKTKIELQQEKKEIILIDSMDSSLFYNTTSWEPIYKLSDTINDLFSYYLAL